MLITDLMTADPITARVDFLLRMALERMETHQIHHLPVLNADRHLIGIISDRDCRLAMNSPFIERTYWQQTIVDRLTVREIMTPAPITIDSSDDSQEAARLLLVHQIGCLPVMRDETLVGIVTRSDVLLAYLQLQRMTDRFIIDPDQPPPRSYRR